MTIAEAMVTLGLFAFVLNLASGLIRSYTQTIKFAGGVDKSMEATQNALSQIRNEAAKAFSIASPTSGASATLTFDKVWTDSTTRLPNPNAAFPANWNPLNPDWVDRVTYTLQRNRLQRTSAREGAAVMVADEIEAFRVQMLPNRNLFIEISTRQDKIVRKFSTETFLGLLR
jgi:type II secretory pathway component PulJ